MEDEIIDSVDPSGKILGQTTRKQAYRQGILHSAVNILIFNSNNQIYIQQRSRNKSVFPLCWDISAAEHLKNGEDFLSAVIRGLKEELSIEGIKPELIRKKHVQKSIFERDRIKLREYELVELYSVTYDGKISINHQEVEKGKFVSLKQLQKMLSDKNVYFTPWGRDELHYLINNHKSGSK